MRSVKGSHHKYVKGSRKVIVPHPKKDLKFGTLKAIMDQAGFSISDLEK
ncbi:MAG: type II toxin-antitoxin system HicA family toxin [Rickettsiales bacterium]|nr:type II toxin-antitoxin system HicA family toxin [Rickettsiales bacterium]